MLHNSDSTVKDSIVTLENYCEDLKYNEAIILYEEKGRDLFENFIVSPIENLNFFDMILICYRGVAMKDKALSITTFQIHKLLSQIDRNTKEFNQRLAFYCLIHAEIAKEKNQLVNEFMALSFLKKLNSLNDTNLKRRSHLLLKFYNGYVSKVLVVLFVLMTFEIVFLKLYQNVALPLFLLIGTIYLLRSYWHKEFDAKMTEGFIKILSRLTMPSSMQSISKAIN